MKLIILGVALFALFIILDLLWFQVAGNFFKSQIGSIARLGADGAWDIRYLPAAAVYVLMSVGILVFVLPVATSWTHALVLGGLFGLVGYGIYDMTNLATLSAWTLRFALVDMAWGTVLCGAASAVAYALSTTFFA